MDDYRPSMKKRERQIEKITEQGIDPEQFERSTKIY